MEEYKVWLPKKLKKYFEDKPRYDLIELTNKDLDKREEYLSKQSVEIF